MTTPKPTPPVAEAVGVVTRQHREEAVTVMRAGGKAVTAWLPKGKVKPGVAFDEDLNRVATAIAGAEARGEARASRSDGAEHRAWAEGYEAGWNDCERRVVEGTTAGQWPAAIPNPYPPAAGAAPKESK